MTARSLQLSVEVVALPLDREVMVAGRRVLAPLALLAVGAESDLSGVVGAGEVLVPEAGDRLGRVVRVSSGETLELHPVRSSRREGEVVSGVEGRERGRERERRTARLRHRRGQWLPGGREQRRRGSTSVSGWMEREKGEDRIREDERRFRGRDKSESGNSASD